MASPLDSAFQAADRVVPRIGDAMTPGLPQMNRAAQQIGFGNVGGRVADRIGYGSSAGSVQGIGSPARQIGGYDPFLDGVFASYMQGVNNNWESLMGQMPQSSSSMASLGGDWTGVDQWNSQIQQAQQQVAKETGVTVPANVIKAVMKIESNGQMLGANGSGYAGLMQVGPGSMGAPYDMNRVVSDPTYSIYAGTKELALRYQDSGQMPWENVAVGYFSGHYTPNGAADSFGTTDYDYQQQFTNYLTQLNQAGGGTSGSAPGSSAFTSIWGGSDAPITQEFGLTAFSQGQGASMYGYGADYGVQGHPGVDVGIPAGTQLHSPVAGVVKMSGGTGFYCDGDEGLCGPGQGELMIELANGDQLILGHMRSISVPIGTPIRVGQAVGVSGSENGAHVHVEYRRKTPGATSSGYTIIDPRTVLGGPGFAGYGGGAGGVVSAPQPMNLNQLIGMLWTGQPVPGYSY